MKEIWKDVKDYEGSYQVSNLGRVKSLTREISNGTGIMTLKGRIRKPQKIKTGYERIVFGDLVSRYIHRLVALHFIPNPDNKPEVNHKDANKSNNKTTTEYTIVGKACESTDKMFENSFLPELDIGDILAVMSTSSSVLPEYVHVISASVLSISDT